MSSFKRKVKTPAGDMTSVSSSTAGANPAGPDATTTSPSSSSMVTVAPISGVKPWIHTGLGMVSSGHRELDDMLHGGFAAGSIITYYGDEYSNYSETLMAYSLAEGLSHGHKTLVCGCEESQFESLLQNVPFNLSFDKIHAKDPSPASEVTKESPDHGLKIAWQYEKYLVKNASQTTNKLADARGLSYCCSYDLSRRLQPEIMDNGSLLLSPLSDPSLYVSATGAKEALQTTLHSLLQSVIGFLRQQYEENPRSMARIFLPQTHQLLAPYLLTSQLHATDVYRLWTQFLTALRRIIAEARVIVHISMPSPSKTSLLPLDLYTACHILTDVILEVESFAGHADTIPPEFRDFVAFFRIRHMHQRGLLASPPPKATKYGMKRDRRKLHIELLHLPPEESRAMQSSNSINCSSSSLTSTNPGINANTMKMATLMGLTAAQQQQQQQPSPSSSHAHDHSHSHQHGHSHGAAGHIRLEVEADDNTAPFGSSDTPASTTQGGRSSSLAAALASARAARSAASQPVSSTEALSSTSAPTTPSPLSDAAGSRDASDDATAATFTVRPIAINSANVRSGGGGVSSFLRKKPASSAPPSLDF